MLRARGVRGLHVSPLERLALAAGSALVALRDPRRGDMVATLGEVTAGRPLAALRERMAADPNGDGWGPRLLRERPRLRAKEVDSLRLAELPPHSFGAAWYSYLQRHGFDPNERAEVQFVADDELRWVMQRYREVHDFWHVLTGLEPTVEGELALKWFEMVQTGLPMPALAAFVGPLRLAAEPDSLRFFLTSLLPWASRSARAAKFLLAVPYEDLLALPLDAVREDLRISPAPHRT